MAAKYQLITELYRRTGVAVAKNPQAWQGFLSSACRNYKYRFDEQLLIYAQRPDAVAVAKLETWNRQFKRWTNKDSNLKIKSNKKVWWKCKNGHEWQAIISNRTNKNQGCPFCKKDDSES